MYSVTHAAVTAVKIFAHNLSQLSAPPPRSKGTNYCFTWIYFVGQYSLIIVVYFCTLFHSRRLHRVRLQHLVSKVRIIDSHETDLLINTHLRFWSPIYSLLFTSVRSRFVADSINLCKVFQPFWPVFDVKLVFIWVWPVTCYSLSTW